jgi:gliding motility-associated-like protein
MAWVFNYTDCAGSSHDWIYTYTIDIPDFTPAADELSTVDCLVDAQVQPTPPSVNDFCGNPIIPTLTTTPTDIPCEGTMVWVFNYTDCAGNSHNWIYTYTIDLNTAPIVPANEASTIECLAYALPPTTPVVGDQCSNNITPILESITDNPDPLTCEGTRTYVYSYTDCATNISYWTYIYTIDLSTAPVIPADEVLTVECLADALPPATPVITDQCNNNITPILESITDNPNPLTCEGTRTYVYSYTDCAANISFWTYTYTIDISTLPSVPTDEESIVACVSEAIAPVTPVIIDICDNILTAIQDSIIDNPQPLICAGTKIYYYSYTDCGGNTSYWKYTYTISDPIISITCPENQSFDAMPGDIYSIPELIASDNCSGGFDIIWAITGATIRNGTGTDASGFFDLGISNIFWTITDTCGNISYCNTEVEIIFPTIICPDKFNFCSNIGLQLLSSTGESPVDGEFSGLGVSDSGGLYYFDPSIGTGTHIITYTWRNVNNYEGSCFFEITVYPIPEFTISNSINPSCYGYSDGEIEISITDGTSDYFIDWGISSLTTSLSNITLFVLPDGEYNITITDAQLCSYQESISLIEPDSLQVEVLISSDYNGQSISCYSMSDGSLNTNVLGGTSPYLFIWSENTGYQITPDLGNLSTGTYSVTVDDDHGCQAIGSVDLTQPEELSLGITINHHVSCYGSNDGNVTATVSGGTPEYSYLWDDPAGTTSEFATQLPPGTWNLTVTDINWCFTTRNINITEPEALEISHTYIDVRCYNEENGSASVTVTGGTPTLEGYTYIWNDPDESSLPDLTNMPAGTYICTVTDFYNCTISDTVVISQPEQLAVNVISTPVVCGNSLGSLTAVVSGGNGGNVFEWSDGSNADYINNLLEGNYNVTVWDIMGCSITSTTNVDMQGNIDLNITEIHPVICFGFNDGSLSTDSPNGADPLGFLWSNNEITRIISDIYAGDYVITITDDWGCTGTAAYTLSQPEQFNISFNSVDVLCSEDNLGSAEAFISGGTLPYQYVWSPGDTTLSINNLESGEYEITVTDNNLCTFSNSVIINEYLINDPFLGHDTTLCEGDIYILSPIDDYAHYEWNTGSTSTSTTVTEPGYFSLTVTDIYGCTESSSLNINYAPYPEITSVSTTVGTITVIATNGTTPYNYSYDGYIWQQSNNLNNLPSGLYIVWVRDDNYCIVTTEVFLDQILKIPSFFTPNGDGYNDIWTITGLYQFPNAQVFIFDRFGKKIGVMYATDAGWNGYYMGTPLPSDTYWYTIDLNDENKPTTGHVTIKR